MKKYVPPAERYNIGDENLGKFLFFLERILGWNIKNVGHNLIIKK